MSLQEKMVSYWVCAQQDCDLNLVRDAKETKPTTDRPCCSNEKHKLVKVSVNGITEFKEPKEEKTDD